MAWKAAVCELATRTGTAICWLMRRPMRKATRVCSLSMKRWPAGANPPSAPSRWKSCQPTRGRISVASRSWSGRRSISFPPVLTAWKPLSCAIRTPDRGDRVARLSDSLAMAQNEKRLAFAGGGVTLSRTQKKQNRASARFCLEFGAQEKTRTSTVLPPLGPEPSASTNSATWALREVIAHRFQLQQRCRRCGGAIYGSDICL